MSRPRAAVDVGSNSVRLLVVGGDGHRIVRLMRITRLAEGVDASGQLRPDAIVRTLVAIDEFAATWTSHGVERGRVAIGATSAVRDAANRQEFVDAVAARTGVTPRVLSGTDEAALAFRGALAVLDRSGPNERSRTAAADNDVPEQRTPHRTAVVVDIGGGSTEIIAGDATGQVAASVSLQLGCVRATERFFPDDPPTPAQIDHARQAVDELLAGADAVVNERAADADVEVPLIAVAGTATTLGALHLGLDDYDPDRIHGSVLPAGQLSELAARLLGMSAEQRARLGPVQPGREDVIHAGALVLDAICRRWAFGHAIISETDGLDGLVDSIV